MTAFADDHTNHPLVQAYSRADDLHVPISALVELTHACNVDCEHCYLDLQPDKKIGALSTDEWKRIFGELKGAGCLFLTMSGGELLIRRDWFELGTHARELGFALRLYTNGTLIDDKAADQIKSLRPLGVEISLLGGIAVTHDAITRRKGAFEKTIAGIKRLKERDVPVILKCVVMDRNAGEINELRTLAATLGCTLYFDMEISPKNDGHDVASSIAPRGNALLEAARNVLGDAVDDGAPFLTIPNEERLPQPPCGAGRRTCHIGPTGNLHPCTQWTTPIGSLRSESFQTLWNGSIELDRIRRITTADLTYCNECELLGVCSPCMALSLLERGEHGGPSPTKCASAELRAKALGITGKSAWLEARERGELGAIGESGGPGETLVQLKTRDGRTLALLPNSPSSSPSR